MEGIIIKFRLHESDVEGLRKIHESGADDDIWCEFEIGGRCNSGEYDVTFVQWHSCLISVRSKT